MAPRRLVLALTGASGAVFGIRLLEMLRPLDIETHLVVSPAGWLTVEQETGRSRRDVESLADVCHGSREIGASIASGSFRTLGMIVAPCSMRTLAGIAMGLSDSLVTRAADVTLKERRRLVLLARESPLNLAHLRNMTTVTEMGGIVCPPVPAFYQHPTSIEELVDQCCARALALFDIEVGLIPEWPGVRPRGPDDQGNGS
jgi:flavin prenyltransferase